MQPRQQREEVPVEAEDPATEKTVDARLNDGLASIGEAIVEELYALLDAEVADGALVSDAEEGVAANGVLDVAGTLDDGWGGGAGMLCEEHGGLIC